MEIAASSAEARVVYAIVDELAQRTIGHRLFTVMRYLPETVEVERLYSSNASAYPLGGRKPKQGTPWGDAVLDRGEVFIAADADGVRAAFSDHALLSDLGISAIMNIPIRFRGRVLGTMNLSHEAEHFTSEMIAPGRILAALLVPLLLERAGR
ncbi:MAG: GAF domain-containing protein [Alphaproteobacteria bacterium]